MKTKICSKCKEVIKLCHYSNLQLLKEEDNLRKDDKLNWKLVEIDQIKDRLENLSFYFLERKLTND